VAALPQFQWATTALGLMSLLVLFSSRIRGMKKVPGPLTAMVVATLVQSVFNFPGVATIGTAFGGIPTGLPSFFLPSFTLAQAVQLMGPTFTIALLGAIESLQSLLQVVEDMYRRGVQIWLCYANHRVKAKFWKYGVLEKLPAQGYADKFSAHLLRLRSANTTP
jgi:MFS superfamily sulfate permease-like transporter